MKRGSWSITLGLTLVFWQTASAQPGAAVRFIDPPAGRLPGKPVRSCGELRSFTTYEFSVTTATLVPGSSGTPEYCRVTGQILPEVRFEVSLPTQWNLRFYMTGNGGFAGEPLESPVRARQRLTAIQRGFAFAITDTGHDANAEPLASFAVNSQKLLDYAFRSLHVTAETAKRIIAAYYGEAPLRSYFEGCSTGGRQALILAQRFPQDFDGIVAGAPVLDFTGTMASNAACVQALMENPIPYGKLPLLAEKIYGKCDAVDGLKDGLIEDPRKCDFRPARDLPQCPAGEDRTDCFTAGQIKTLERLYGDLYSQGKRIYPGWPVGAEIAGADGRSGWNMWIVRKDGGMPTWGLFAESFFRYMAFPEKDPNYTLARFDLDKDPARLQWISSVLNATEPDLSPFRNRGGKLLMYFGWADPALNPLMGVEYYERVLQQMGPSATEFFRLFMVPGMFHCSGGVGPNVFDALGAVMRWVEQARAPERLVASQTAAGKVVRTRPLCPYPQVARYTGKGSIDEAESFVCRSPER